MTIIKNRQEFVAGSGLSMFIEQYYEVSVERTFWRYGAGSSVWKRGLVSKPNKRKLIDNY